MFDLDHPSVIDPTIAGVEITVDREGRFSLSALHRASGRSQLYKPKRWVETSAIQKFIAEVRGRAIMDPVICKKGRNGETYACEPIAIMYAGWLGTAFRDQTKQAIIDYRSGKFTHPFIQRNYSGIKTQQLRLSF